MRSGVGGERERAGERGVYRIIVNMRSQRIRNADIIRYNIGNHRYN